MSLHANSSNLKWYVAALPGDSVSEAPETDIRCCCLQVEFFNTNRISLQSLFTRYAMQQSSSDVAKGSSSWQEVRDAHTRLSCRAFLRVRALDCPTTSTAVPYALV